MNLPVIRSIGPPPEKHAARVVSEMCRYLYGEQKRFQAATTQAAKLRRSPLGCPKAQQRFCDRMCRAGGAGLLASYLETGKRGKFEMAFIVWRVVHPVTVALVKDDHVFPAKPWLTGEIVRIKGPTGEITQAVALSITHHALQRLAECGQVRDPNALILELRKLWQQLIEVKRPDDQLVVRIPLAGGLAICEREEPRADFVVKTVLRPGMFDGTGEQP